MTDVDERGSDHVVEDPGERFAPQPMRGELRDAARGVAGQRGGLELRDRRALLFRGSGRQPGGQRPLDLELSPLHERRDVAQAELPVAAGRAEAFDLAGVRPALHRRFPDPEKLRHLARR